MLEQEQLKRYNRQLILPEIGMIGQERLMAARVLMIGAGGLGCPVLQYLAASGAGAIGIVDDDVVDISNLHRQILYTMADVGQPKAITAKQKLEQLNPFVKLFAHQERLTAENAKRLIGMYDLVIDGSDNFATRYLVNDACAELDKPLVFGSIFKFEGHVSVFNYKDGPNYRDLFPEAPPEGDVPNCSEIGVMGVLPGIIGTWMAGEAVKIICGIGEPLSGKLLTMNLLDNSITLFNIAKQKQASPKPGPVNENEPVDLAAHEISIETLTKWLAEIPGEIHLVDVREDYEFEEHNLGGVNISLYELSENAGALPADKKLVLVCQTGQRSKMALQLLKPVFKGEMYSLKNGIS